MRQLPVRKGQGGLRRKRPEEIIGAPAFQCHKTVDYAAPEAARAGDRPQQCAGLMALLHRAGRPNQIMQVAQRLGALDPSTLDLREEAYSSIEEAFEAHKGIV